ncbi:ATP-binding protein [bacterium]|nr:ATP-binding protein [bacterium]
MTHAYEKLGVFYLGREYNEQTQSLGEEVLLYDAKDLTTHAVIVGMTGSGKTGLGIGLIEEALIDKIPVIALDPKGDLTNLLLTFPSLSVEEFRPWINQQEALKKGQDLDQYARTQAETWKNGLADWDQGEDRIELLKNAAECVIYTPGSNAGIPVSVLKSFAAPAPEILEDLDFLRERIQTTTTSLLTLLRIDADPITSREHIVIANIFEFFWAQGKGLDLGGLIQTLQNPPFERIGVMDLEQFYPAKERFELAMKLNNLLAAPGFEAWLNGVPLSIPDLLYSKQGKPKASIFTISHLGDEERMFFVTILLNEILGWMRMQSGTTSLRALLYIDELFGYMPPVQNPPSKTPLLTLLKQARAFGLGLVLSTQNPVDLDYKGLSNTGTWFIGRLQTERDKERLLAGLEGVSLGPAFERNAVEQTLSSLAKRVFYLHNVHETKPVLFQTRWALSYLAGPLSRDQIKLLMSEQAQSKTLPGQKPTKSGDLSQTGPSERVPPLTPPGIETYYLRPSGAGHDLVYFPGMLARVDIQYSHPKYSVNERRTKAFVTVFNEGTIILDWDDAFPVDPARIDASPVSDAAYSELPAPARSVQNHQKWNKDLFKWISATQPLTLFSSKRFKEMSSAYETEAEFRNRLTLRAREQRDLEVEKIRQKYAPKFASLKERLLRAEQTTTRQLQQSQSRKINTAVSFGTAILSAFLGRKTISISSASRFGNALKSASQIQKERLDVDRAQERAELIQQQLNELEQKFQEDITRIEITLDPATEPLQEIQIKPKTNQITLELFGICWLPYRTDISGKINPDWQ